MKQFPKFARIGALKLRHISDGYYYRDAGDWTISSKWKGASLVCSRCSDGT